MAPQLRPRNNVVNYTVRSASHSLPTKPRAKNSKTKPSKPRRETSPPSAQLLWKIWNKIVNDGSGDIVHQYKVQTLDDGTVVQVEPGSTVFIQNDESTRRFHENKDNVSYLWIATILEIRKDDFGTLGKVKWFYNFQDARSHLERPGGMSREWLEIHAASTGAHELFESNHIDIIDMSTVEDLAFVHKYVPSDQAQVWFTKDSWYTRGSLTVVGNGTISRRSPMKYASLPTVTQQHTCCPKGYNPEEDRQILCKHCKIFYHVEELTQLIPEEPIDPLTRVLRGLGWEKNHQNPVGWSLVGNWGLALDDVDVLVNLSPKEQVHAMNSLERVLGSIKGIYECKECLHHM